MRKILLLVGLFVLLAACQKDRDEAPPPAAESEAPVAETPAPEAAQPPATPGVPMDSQLAAALDASLAGPQRSDDNRARDRYRNPRETLEFFGLAPGMTVIEITPGGGWYTEVLAPALQGRAAYVAAIAEAGGTDNERLRAYLERSNNEFRQKLQDAPDTYGEVEVREFEIPAPSFGPDDSADLVLTFRNVHNWTQWGTDQAMFAAFFRVLKPGGVLGVVEHRAAEGVERDSWLRSGYVPQEYVIELARTAGFELAASSEINANPNDTKDHPNGVWTLPPSLRLPEGEDGERYRSIGESDRMTLKFIKPMTAD